MFDKGRTHLLLRVFPASAGLSRVCLHYKLRGMPVLLYSDQEAASAEAEAREKSLQWGLAMQGGIFMVSFD